ncbi:MAG: hypothetical protein IGS38_08085 [Synechococcales cyanobacterium M58_A2018_015]|nr:hypothetical protein [Synechococcales cyanobacterium M58_A2018_015]
MNIPSWLRSFRWLRVLTIVLAGTLVYLTTACNSGDLQGARPQNPPVQLGGQNNPYKQGGDSYTQFKSPAGLSTPSDAAAPQGTTKPADQF